MGTCKGNLGTVLEHVVLSTATTWVIQETVGSPGAVHYLDTQAMAPMNAPVDDAFLSNLIACPPRVDSTVPARTYTDTLQRARQLMRDGHKCC